MTDTKVTISRETLLPAATIKRIKKECDALGLDIVAFAWRVQNAALAAQPATVQPVEPVATSYADHQQRIGAPLTFFTSVAAQAYRAAATRDDVTHEDAMRVALQAVQGAAPPAPAAVPMTDEQIERLRENTFSTNNPFCPVDSKSMRKAVRAIERAHGIAAAGDK